MATDPSIIAAAVAGIPSIFAAAFAYRASSRANQSTAEATAEVNRISQQKVDGEAFERSQAFYQKVLANAEAEMQRLQGQVDRLRTELDRVTTQLVTEQGVSGTLRGHVRVLQDQVGHMELTIAAMRHPPGGAAPPRPVSGGPAPGEQ